MSNNEEKILTSQTLTEELNEDRRKAGLHELPAVNSMKGSTGAYARKDKSFNSSFDFLRQMLGKKDK